MSQDLLVRTARLREGVRLKELAQGWVVLCFPTSQAFEVNHSAAEILRHLKAPLLLRDLAELVATKYRIGAQEIATQLVEFLQECCRLGLVEIRGQEEGQESTADA